MTAAGDSQQSSAATGGVGLVAFSTESPFGLRGNVHMADTARGLRREGVPSRLFHVHLVGDGEAENGRRLELLVERLAGERCRWAVFDEVWTPELGQRLRAVGIGIIETRSHTFEGALFAREDELLTHVGECATGQALDELANLVEIVGPHDARPVTSIDLRTGYSCGYQRSLADNPFYRDVLDAPEVARHRGCAYCLSARESFGGAPEQMAQRIIERIRNDRQVFPAVETIWMAFAETYYDALAIAFRTTRGDPAWQGITLSMQCRPDVIAQRATEIEALAAGAALCGARLRIGVVGFENFSPPEILVLNRGAAPAALDAAAVILNRWSAREPTGLVVRGFTPSFILFTPWTRIEDLDINMERIVFHGLWQANIERLRIGPGTPAFEKARRDGLVVDAPVRAAGHPNGYSSEREFHFVDAQVAAVADGFERLRPLARSEQPELLAALLAAARGAGDPAALDWNDVADAWEDVGAAARGS